MNKKESKPLEFSLGSKEVMSLKSYLLSVFLGYCSSACILRHYIAINFESQLNRLCSLRHQSKNLTLLIFCIKC